MFQPTTECVDSLSIDDVAGQAVPESGTGRTECSVADSRPVSESESERQRARNGTNECERDFSRERATIHTSESKGAKFKTAHDFSFYSAVPWGSD